MTNTESNARSDTQAWSAHNLPKPKPSRMMRFSALAVAVGLITVVLASAVKDPIPTGGARMEPTRFTTSVQQQQERIKTAVTPPNLVVASDAP
jgi:hypothetical protein